MLQSHNCSIHTMEDCATVLPEHGNKLRELDPTEEHFHVESCASNPTVLLVYRKRDWLLSLERSKQRRQLAEQERQQALLDREKALQFEEEERQACNNAIKLLRQKGLDDKQCQKIIDQCLEGEQPATLIDKLGLTKFATKKKQTLTEQLMKEFE